MSHFYYRAIRDPASLISRTRIAHGYSVQSNRIEATEGIFDVRRWFFTGMAVAMIAISLVAFVPSMIHPAKRHAPLSALAATHGAVYFAWLLLFLIQSRLIATRHVAWHRRLGLSFVIILALMIPLAYTTTIAMVSRGCHDLSGDLRIDRDPSYGAVFPCAICSSSLHWRSQLWLIGAGRRFISA